MSVFKIALRSIQHRGLGSILSMLSMALGVTLIVVVLTIYGVVEHSFKSNSSFGYDVIVGARGGSTQLMLNTVFYLSRPVENVPYEYYLAFCDADQREKELTYSIEFNTHRARAQHREISDELSRLMPFGGPLEFVGEVTSDAIEYAEQRSMTVGQEGTMYTYTDLAIPLALGDYFNEKFRVVGTTPDFFNKLVLDIETGKTFEFASGRAFEEFNLENGYFEAVVGSAVARESGTKVGDVIYPIHGDPNSPSAHIHEQGFTVVGILEPTGTPHDRVAFTNLEGHFLMEDHANPLEKSDPYAVPESSEDSEYVSENSSDSGLYRTRLPIEQREVTAVLIASFTGEDEADDDEFTEDEFTSVDDEAEKNEDEEFIKISMGQQIAQLVDDGYLESSLDWSDYRPNRSQRASDAISPVYEVTSLFETIVSPIRWALLFLTVMICIVSGISILVGIYNSMSQRKHEIAVIRALGADRSKVMSIMLMESLLLALGGGLVGWSVGHVVNMLASPAVEKMTGVQIGLLKFAPPTPFLTWEIPSWVPLLPDTIGMSPEFLLIPGLILLAVLVGIYPAISAYRTDVANSLSK